jgi:NAD(P)-dependent dehydrogenase (short-subunit alcohol dehydrogenase family)
LNVRQPDFSLTGKSIVVSGASRGIGAACAVRCAAAGASEVTVLARSETDLREVARQVADAGARARVVVCDVTEASEIAAAFAETSVVDVLINSAGANQPEAFVNVTRETFERLVGLNLGATYFLSQLAAKHMIASGKGGSIITISSQMGHVGAANRTLYCAVKHAVEGLTKALAVELAPHRIRAVSIAPTFIRTEMTAEQLDDAQVGPDLLSKIPAGRFGSVEEVADAVVFAASDAAALMTGTSLVIDGGWTAQ